MTSLDIVGVDMVRLIHRIDLEGEGGAEDKTQVSGSTPSCRDQQCQRPVTKEVERSPLVRGGAN